MTKNYFEFKTTVKSKPTVPFSQVPPLPAPALRFYAQFLNYVLQINNKILYTLWDVVKWLQITFCWQLSTLYMYLIAVYETLTT